MTAVVYDWSTYQPQFSPSSIPALPLLGLSDAEKAMVARLQGRMVRDRYGMEVTDAYYGGMQVISNLEIAIPKKIADVLRTLVGWPRIAVDPYVERLGVDGFRLADASDADRDLADLWAGNGLDAEQSVGFTDALSMARCYWTVGAPDSPGDMPRICVESPLNMTVQWDLTGRKARTALQGYWVDDVQHAALYLPEQTVHVVQDGNRAWQVSDRDMHGFGVVPVTRMANNPRSNRRDGHSEITPELMSVVDGACRTLLGLEVAREFYSVPQKLILGAAESDFQSPDGTPRAAWDTYINKVLALERDEEGHLPEVKQLAPYDPSVFTKLVEMYASQAAGILAAVPQDLGLYTQGNPTSAEAASVTEGRRDRRARRKQSIFGVALVDTMQLAVRFMNGGVLPDEFRRMSVDWADVSIETPSITADALSKLVTAKVIPARSDVTLKRARFSATERARLEQDWLEESARTALQQIADAVTAAAAAPGLPPVAGDGAPAG